MRSEASPARCLGTALIALFLLASPAKSQESKLHLEDRILASVDDDPILASDVERALRLGLVEDRRPGETDAELRSRVLEEMIDERLRFHEVDRYGLNQVPVSEIELRIEEIRSRFPSEAEFQQRLAELNLSEDGLSQLVARQLIVLAYVEDRLAARVLVGLEDIRDYYESQLVPALGESGQPVPPLEEVREQIRQVLREQKLNEEITRWTEELESRATVTRFKLEGEAHLPPLVDTVTSRADQ
ncbi:MAG TPA: SurA N-terminal domain-containing protein [Thermoanaerobaculia bacterium]|nr:SurA N-terminal domain-containing protein [Thermoanaerobaculia bacterium]